MESWHNASGSGRKKDTSGCNLDLFNYIRNGAVENGFAHHVPDIKRDDLGDFATEIWLDYYLALRAPNPSEQCNMHIKWRAFFKS